VVLVSTGRLGLEYIEAQAEPTWRRVVVVVVVGRRHIWIVARRALSVGLGLRLGLRGKAGVVLSALLCSARVG
jgi:hypothetical protein